MADPEEILQLADDLDKIATKLNRKAIDRLEHAVEQAAKSFCGSWIGYHSRVYYKGLQPVPPGARFSAEWGFGDRMSNETRGEWCEFDFDSVVAQIQTSAGSPDTKKLEADARLADEKFEDSQAQLLSMLSRYQTAYPDDKFLAELVTKIEAEKQLGYAEMLEAFRPKQAITRDAVAGHAGMQAPPHFHVLAQIGTWRNPFTLCTSLSKHARRAGSHIASLEKKAKHASRVGTHVFIGHGRSPVWKDFRDFIRDRVKLPWDEFNRVPVAGVPTTTRLLQMLDEAAIAFLILTAEDEPVAGKFHPRMNVVHEAGLFQGRLGLERAIILLEEGCEEFSNVHGLGQIRFPRGNISQAFEEIRRVLEREELISVAE
jgi:hypothetical protein